MKKAPAGVSVQLAADPDVFGVMRNPVYPKEYLESVHYKHITPEKLHQKLAYRAIQAIRGTFDLATGYNADNMTEAKWLQRMIFLETVAGVPGMVGGMLRHLRSLRRMQRDMGWINTLLEEAENERMHLLTFLEIRKPGLLFRSNVILAQGVMFNMFFLAYLVSPKFCHSLVGYLEEEAVKTYTHALKDIDAGKLWPNRSAPDIAKSYWWLGEQATMRDLILAIRADEACHSHVNHTLGKLQADATNPFLGKDSHMVP
jgi:threonyl-tRNA synthetase